jgi:hypothetical protein
MNLPDGLTDTLTLDAVADLLRISRNTVGHPTGATVDEDTARIHLQMAGTYLQKMTTLRAHLEAQAGEQRKQLPSERTPRGDARHGRRSDTALDAG